MNQFAPSGTDVYAHLRQHVAHVAPAAFEGSWTTVEIQPDVFARQRYTVGVAVCDSRGLFAFRLLEDLATFECLFRASEVASIRSLLESAEQSLMRAQRAATPLKDVGFETDGVLLGELWATSGSSPESVLARLFADVVPFLPSVDEKKSSFVTLDTAAVRAQVSEALKRIAGLSFERIVTAPDRLLLDHETGVTHRLEFNLEPPGKVGSVISAVFKTPQTVELSYLRASTDLATFRSMRGRDLQPGIFVMAPKQGSMPAPDYGRIEAILDEQSWRLEQQGFVVSTHDEAGLLAQDIWEWSGLAPSSA